MPFSTELPGVAVITGAASGLGRGVAIAFAAAGCPHLALLDINPDGLEETKRLAEAATETSIKTRTYHLDVTDAKLVESTYIEIQKDFNRIDYAIQCAGIMVWSASSSEMSIDDFDRQTNVNYRGVWLCSRAALKVMKTQSLDVEAYPSAKISPSRGQRGAVVNISSVLAQVVMATAPSYCGAKAAVQSMTRADALDHTQHQIRVNAVQPGIIDTPMTAPTPEIREMLEKNMVQPRAPMKRFGTPEEIADVVLFLASNKSSYVTGSGWVVDGGWLIS